MHEKHTSYQWIMNYEKILTEVNLKFIDINWFFNIIKITNQQTLIGMEETNIKKCLSNSCKCLWELISMT